MDITLAIQLLSLIPPLQFGTPADPPTAEQAPAGQGTLLIAACRPGQPIVVMPGGIPAAAGKDGVAKIRVPAQAQAAQPYRFMTDGQDVQLNGTVAANEALTGVCP